MRGLGSTLLRLEEAGGGFETETNREAAMMVRSTPHLGNKCRDSRSAHLILVCHETDLFNHI